MLRDRLVVGIRGTAMLQKLQMDAELTLENAKKVIRQKEAVYEQQRELQGDGSAKADSVKEAFQGTVTPTQQVEACGLSGGSLPGYCDLKKR